jgi:hypothetical protein
MLLVLVQAACAGGDFSQILKETFGKGFDPYKGQYKGKVATNRWVEQRYNEDGVWILDNLRTLSAGEKPIDQPKWTSIQIDSSKLEKVYFMMCVFVIKLGPIKYDAGHAQMLFEFAPGGAMTPEGDIGGFVNSYEAFKDEGEIYDPIIKGMNGTYESIFTISSKKYAFEASASRDTRICLYELNITKEEKQELLRLSIQEAMNKERLLKEPYHTTRNSCITNQFRILNMMLPVERRFKEWHSLFGWNLFRTSGTVVPRKVGRTLVKGGIVNGSEIRLECPDEALQYLDDGVVAGARRAIRSRIFDELYED